ncbi:MAG: cellulase family glycosylhydrolase [Planctomycetia bacterium]|nr:cellulase family glycosylhydrolase [Planctomycetia bacterium]
MKLKLAWLIACGFTTCALASRASAEELERVQVSGDKQGFILDESKRPFVPWGFNYDHDETGRLIEDYWDKEWDKVAEDFSEMRDLGANVVRIHLQTGKFLRSAAQPNEQALAQLKKLLALAEKTGLYLDLTGLGCYHKQDVPAWYDELDEEGRWDAQSRFWEAVAQTCAASPAVFCYDLMNEPVVPGGQRAAKDWLGPAFAGKHFVQVITLSQQDRPRPEIAKAWIHQLTSAIRKHDRRHLVTVGLVDWSLDRKGLTSGFVPARVSDDLDFLCVHLYPHKGKIDEALDTLHGFAIGKPVVIEETYTLHAPLDQFEKFIDGSKKDAAGWIGFYWGKTPAECKKSGTIGDAIIASWLDFFVRKGPEMRK